MAHDVHGVWDIVQSNNYRVRVDINQSMDGSNNLLDGPLTGSAQEYTPHGTPISNQQLSQGMLSGDFFFILIDWMNGTKGQYSGTFDPAGNLSGVTFDVDTPTAQATWIRQNV
jgi:hypothetical protein